MERGDSCYRRSANMPFDRNNFRGTDREPLQRSIMSENNLMLLSSLKLKLQTISSELSNLTIRDLDELKWTQKQIIISKVFHSSKFLNGLGMDLDDIESEKQTRLSALKQERLSEIDLKLRKKEVESIFRTSYMRIFLNGLEKQRWPPCLVPFSDPLNEIMESNSKFLQALDFLVSIELPALNNVSPPPQILEKNLPPRSARSAKADSIPRVPDEPISVKTPTKISHLEEKTSVEFPFVEESNSTNMNTIRVSASKFV